jgi:vacuolar-type H+-ATPase subunit I/STV1
VKREATSSTDETTQADGIVDENEKFHKSHRKQKKMAELVECECHQVEWESRQALSIHREDHYRRQLAEAEARQERLLTAQANMEQRLAAMSNNPHTVKERMSLTRRRNRQLAAQEQALQRRRQALFIRTLTIRLKEARLRYDELRLERGMLPAQ